VVESPIDGAPRALETHSLIRALSPERWKIADATPMSEGASGIASACRTWFPELQSWSDESLVNAYATFVHDLAAEVNEGPNFRDIDFLIYLYLIQYQVPHAIGDFRSAGAPLVESALREIERLWLGDIIRQNDAGEMDR
jgi:hypothetical protein